MRTTLLIVVAIACYLGALAVLWYGLHMSRKHEKEYLEELRKARSERPPSERLH